MFCDMHILIRDSQEVMLGAVNVLMADLASDIDEAVRSLIVCTDIPHSGQLNITNSTFTTLKFTDAAKSKIISLLASFVVCNVSSWLAHVSPSSPVSVGILPSNRTLEVGASHLDSWPRLVTLEQFPVADDPFTDIVSAVGKIYLDGNTEILDAHKKYKPMA